MLLLTACYSGKRAQFQQQVEAAKTIQAADQKTVNDTRQKVDDRLKAEVIDQNIADSINNKIARYAADLDSFNKAVQFVDDKGTASGKDYRRNKTQLDSSIAFMERYKTGQNYRLRRFTMINEALDVIVNQQHMFDLAAFFGPGKYEIPEDKKSIAQEAFAPLIDSLVKFYNRYADVDKKATLVILGFADGSGFSPESEIATTLVQLLKDPNAPKEKMNQKLSELRAINIGDLMEFSLDQKIPQFKSIKDIDFVFIELGKGEEYPSKKITDYKTDDERRRVVLLFWNILPK
ncbi:MAG: hypothetical protein EAZ62_04755 [Sphingobacteriia bacterium]|nr:MAG: hypothetical protein EAZ62_04755 [Sphingobacteriia bacterium]